MGRTELTLLGSCEETIGLSVDLGPTLGKLLSSSPLLRSAPCPPTRDLHALSYPPQGVKTWCPATVGTFGMNVKVPSRMGKPRGWRIPRGALRGRQFWRTNRSESSQLFQLGEPLADIRFSSHLAGLWLGSEGYVIPLSERHQGLRVRAGDEEKQPWFTWGRRSGLWRKKALGF